MTGCQLPNEKSVELSDRWLPGAGEPIDLLVSQTSALAKGWKMLLGPEFCVSLPS